MTQNTKKSITANGHISFKDPKKEVYSLDDILELIKLNFGYSPYHGKTKSKSTKEYKRIRKKISRELQGKKLGNSTPRNPLYSKVDVYKFLNGDSYKYFVKASNSKEEYERKLKDAEAEFREKMNEISQLGELGVRIEQKKQEVLFRILIDYISKQCIDIDEQLIEKDIVFCENLSGAPVDSLDPNEVLVYSRLHGNVNEYYTLKKSR